MGWVIVWLTLLSLLPSAFTTISSITAAISNAKIASIQATTAEAKIAADEQVLELQSRRDLMIAETANSKLPVIVQTMIAIGPAVYLTKIFIWDKVLQTYTLGTTDPLDANLWTVVTAVVGFYFLSNAMVTTARILKA